MWMTRAAVSNWVAVLMACLGLLVLSGIAAQRLPVDIFPQISVPAIQISANYTGAIPETIERTVTYPLEQSLARVNGVNRLFSTSQEGNSSTQVWLNWGANMQNALVQVLSNVQRAMPGLPQGVSAPSVSQVDVTGFAIMQLSVSGGGLSLKELDEVGYFTILPQISRLPGVATVSVYGGLIRQINVECSPDKLAARGLTLGDVEQALSNSNALLPSGSLRNNRLSYQLKVPTLLQSVDEVGQVVVGVRKGSPILVSDVAKVVDGIAPRSNVYTVNGKEAIGIFINMQPQSNVIEVVDGVRKVLPKLTGVPPGVDVGIVFDQSTYVRTAVKSLIHEGIIGALLVAAVVMLFLRNLKSLFIICIGIPLAVAVALLLLYFGGQTLNIFTLGGLTLALGRLVDDAIVVRENITRHLEGTAPSSGSAGEGKRRSVKRAVLDATHEVGMPVLASTITTIAVLFPVVFLEGISQRLFVPFALAIGFSMMASYVVSMTVDPVLSIWLMKSNEGPPNRLSRALERAFVSCEDAYERCLRWSLRRGWLLIAVLAVLTAVAVGLKSQIPSEFFAESDESLVGVSVRSQQGTSVPASAALAEKVQVLIREALQEGELWTMTCVTGQGSPNSSWISLRLNPPAQRKRSSRLIANAIRDHLKDKFPGSQTFVSSGGLEKGVLNFGASAPIEIQILGYDLNTANSLAQDIQRRVAAIEGITDARISPQGQVPAFAIQIDHHKAALLGLNPTQVARAINTALSGNTVAQNRFIDPYSGNAFGLVTQLEEHYRSHPQDIGAIPVKALVPSMNTDIEGSTPILLRELAKVSISSTPVQIQRKNQQRVINVVCNTIRPLGTVAEEIRGVLKEVKWPNGFSYYLGGQVEQQGGAFASMGLAAALATMLVYMIMASQFKSLTEPLVIMATVPLGLIGVVFILWATQTTFNVMSFMGVIMMVGIVVSNGILLVEFANQLQERGEPLVEATVVACRTRLRPIVMTALATVVGMIPMATGWGGGSQTNEPLARAVIGGLTLSTVLTLVVVPLFYIAVLRRFPRRHEEELD